MRKNIQLKKYSTMTGGELPDTKSLRGMFADKNTEALRLKFRSPFGFCGPQRTKG